MKHFDNFKKHLRSEDPNMPTDFSWENMEDGIFNDSNDDTALASNDFKNIIISVLSILLLVITGLLLWSYFSNSTASKNPIAVDTEMSNTSNNNATQIDIIKTDTKLKSKDNLSIDTHINSDHLDQQNGSIYTVKEEDNSSQNKITLNESAKANNIQENSLNPGLAIASKESSLEQFEDQAQKAKIALTKNNPTPENLVVNGVINKNDSETFTNNSGNDNEEIVFDNTTDNKNETLANPSLSSKEDLFDNEEIIDKREEMILADLPVLNQTLSTEGFYILNKDVTLTKPLKPQVKDSRISLTVGGGSNLIFHQGLKTDNIYNNQKLDFGYSFNTGLQYKLNNKFSISTGVEYNEYYTKLDEKFVDLQSRDLMNTVISYTENPISGIKNEVYGDTTVVDTLTTTIIHHNRINALTLPLMATYHLEVNNWNVGLSAGTSIGFIKTYRGRFLVNDEITFVDPVESSSNNKTVIGISAAISLERKLFDHFAIGGRIGGSKSITAWSNDDSAYSKPITLNGGIYMKYTF